MKHLVVTTDFSANSKAGLRFAIQLSKQTGCRISFFHCIEIMKPTKWSDKRYEEYAKAEIEKAVNKLEKFADALLEESKLGNQPYSFVVEIGLNPDERVTAYAKEVKADAIVSATRGAGAVKKLFGTNASRLINHSSVPVIIVPSSYKAKAIQSIWYASDFENIAGELKTVQAFAASSGLTLSVNHYNYLLNEAKTAQVLNKVVSKYQKPGTDFKLRQLSLDHSLTHYMERDIKKEKPSLVALFTKQNRNWFSRLFLGSNSAEMSFATHTPLLIFRKKDKS
jgi:nucleotide-binding universal stress UspA family protein